MNTLEILKEARAAIANEDWEFSNWNQCTCGHIYRAAVGGTKDSVTENHVMDNLNHPVLMEVAVALGYSDVSRTAGDFISAATQKLRKDQEAFREDGLEVIDRAIAKIEAEHEANRLDVLAQTKEIVNNAVVEEVVTV